MLANCQRNRLAIACRHKSACYIAEVFTFIALLLVSLALSYQSTCFYIDKNIISETASKLRPHAHTPCKVPPELYVSWLFIGTIQFLEVPNELKKKSFSLIYLCMFSYCSFTMHSSAATTNNNNILRGNKIFKAKLWNEYIINKQ